MRNLLGTVLKTTAALFVFAAPLHADQLITSRLDALLGQERQSLSVVSVVPDVRMTALTTLPPVSERQVQTSPAGLTYDRAFLAALPTASGGP
ncbi:MAG: cell wall hydrolase, partial [Yoonia sp.]